MADDIEKIGLFIKGIADVDDKSTIDNDTKILSLGYIDSFSVLDIILFLEEEFDIRVDGDVVSIERFDSIHLIAKLVKELQENR